MSGREFAIFVLLAGACLFIAFSVAAWTLDAIVGAPW